MKRRDFLIRLVGAPIAAAVLPKALPTKPEFFQLDIEDFPLGPFEPADMTRGLKGVPWVMSGWVGPSIQEDIEAMIEKLEENKRYGPYTLLAGDKTF